jgi:hypothetical protein
MAADACAHAQPIHVSGVVSARVGVAHASDNAAGPDPNAEACPVAVADAAVVDRGNPCLAFNPGLSPELYLLFLQLRL